MKVKIKRVGGHELPLPKYETRGAAGMDLRAHHADDLAPYHYVGKHPKTGLPTRYCDISTGGRLTVSCGFAFAIPEGYELQIRSRSGLAKRGIVVVGGVGTCDSDFRGAPLVTLHNMGDEPFTIWEGDRIAQAIIAPVVQAELEEVAELDETERGVNGFGSSGMR